jgi:replication-associated recombination protein RarA
MEAVDPAGKVFGGVGLDQTSGEASPDPYRGAPARRALRRCQAPRHGKGYRYPHDDVRGVVEQVYAPEAVQDRTYYRPTGRGHEATIHDRLSRLRQIVRRDGQ